MGSVFCLCASATTDARVSTANLDAAAAASFARFPCPDCCAAVARSTKRDSKACAMPSFKRSFWCCWINLSCAIWYSLICLFVGAFVLPRPRRGPLHFLCRPPKCCFPARATLRERGLRGDMLGLYVDTLLTFFTRFARGLRLVGISVSVFPKQGGRRPCSSSLLKAKHWESDQSLPAYTHSVRVAGDVNRAKI